MEALPFGLGLIEGFYGREWSHADRLDTLDFLAAAGYRYYVYAPKGDAVLRRRWRDAWEPAQERRLHELSARAAGQGIAWGVGLSPLGLVEEGEAGLDALRAKLAYLDGFSPTLFCLLFDDMPRGVDDLAERQCAAVEAALSVTRARHLLVCPGYYCRDPILERLFGPMPPAYWEELGRRLPAGVGLFWTGERVCSAAYPEPDLVDIAARFGRPPVLWDNYPVNDGARASRFLHVDAVRNRPASLAGRVQAHFANPMNQCHLSRIPLATLAASYAEGVAYDPARAFRAAALALAGSEGAQLLEADRECFQSVGLDGLGEGDSTRLLARYAAIDAPWAREVAGWLRGEFAFDPACLTD